MIVLGTIQVDSLLLHAPQTHTVSDEIQTTTTGSELLFVCHNAFSSLSLSSPIHASMCSLHTQRPGRLAAKHKKTSANRKTLYIIAHTLKASNLIGQSSFINIHAYVNEIE